MRVIVRLNNNKDKDLTGYLSNCKNVSKGVRDLMRMGLRTGGASHTPIVLDDIEVTDYSVVEVNEDDIVSNIMDTANFFNL